MICKEEMKKAIKRTLKPFIPQVFWNALKKENSKRQVKEWVENGCPAPPPHLVKQMTIIEYKEKLGFSTFVETGTYLGDMVEAQKNNFSKIYSVELGVDLFKKAKNRFKDYTHITILQGDSGKVLPNIMTEINQPVLFWLDGHYSGGITAKGRKECPIFEELDAIFSINNLEHILLIDDARCFNGEGDYPTINELTNYIRRKNEKYQVEVKHDIIRCIIYN
ncbi:MAG: hypothetical protein H6584_08815 [Flavobacteriales bacterium]|nr:hypothetical protein [Flavobacteriales bacterium]